MMQKHLRGPASQYPVCVVTTVVLVYQKVLRTKEDIEIIFKWEHARVCSECEVVGPVFDCTLAQHVFRMFRILANDHGMTIPDVGNKREV